MVVTFKEENTIAFKHLFLKGYIDRMDDTYAVYTQRDVYDQIIFAVNQMQVEPCILYFGERLDWRIVSNVQSRS